MKDKGEPCKLFRALLDTLFSFSEIPEGGQYSQRSGHHTPFFSLLLNSAPLPALSGFWRNVSPCRGRLLEEPEDQTSWWSGLWQKARHRSREPRPEECLPTRPPLLRTLNCYPASGLPVMPAFASASFLLRPHSGSLSFPCALRSVSHGQGAASLGSVPSIPDPCLCHSRAALSGTDTDPGWGHHLQTQLGAFLRDP